MFLIDKIKSSDFNFRLLFTSTVVSPNKSANNSSHLAASTSLSRGLASHTPPGRVSGFILPGSSEESDDVPHRGPPTNIPSVEMESDGRESSVGGDSGIYIHSDFILTRIDVYTTLCRVASALVYHRDC